MIEACAWFQQFKTHSSSAVSQHQYWRGLRDRLTDTQKKERRKRKDRERENEGWNKEGEGRKSKSWWQWIKPVEGLRREQRWRWTVTNANRSLKDSLKTMKGGLELQSKPNWVKGLKLLRSFPSVRDIVLVRASLELWISKCCELWLVLAGWHDETDSVGERTTERSEQIRCSIRGPILVGPPAFWASKKLKKSQLWSSFYHSIGAEATRKLRWTTVIFRGETIVSFRWSENLSFRISSRIIASLWHFLRRSIFTQVWLLSLRMQLKRLSSCEAVPWSSPGPTIGCINISKEKALIRRHIRNSVITSFYYDTGCAPTLHGIPVLETRVNYAYIRNLMYVCDTT